MLLLVAVALTAWLLAGEAEVLLGTGAFEGWSLARVAEASLGAGALESWSLASIAPVLLLATAFKSWSLASIAEVLLHASALKSWSLARVADAALVACLWAVVLEVQAFVLTSPDTSGAVGSSVGSVLLASVLRSIVSASSVPIVVFASSVVEAAGAVGSSLESITTASACWSVISPFLLATTSVHWLIKLELGEGKRVAVIGAELLWLPALESWLFVAGSGWAAAVVLKHVVTCNILNSSVSNIYKHGFLLRLEYFNEKK